MAKAQSDTEEDSVADLKLKLRLLQADFYALYGILADKGIVDDKEFQKSGKVMAKYIEKEEQEEI